MEVTLESFIRNQIFTYPSNLNDLLSFNGMKFNNRSEFNNIVKYVDEFVEGDSINRFLVLPGLRDVGKSTVLFQLYDYLLKEKNINPYNILYFSVEDLKKMFNVSILDGVMTYLDVFHNATPKSVDEKVFILIDEAQFDTDWSLIGKILFDSSKNIFLIFTGSSALNLEYNADAARRLLKIPISPLNYSQHLKLKYNFSPNDISEAIVDLIFEGNVEKASELEKNLSKSYTMLDSFDLNEWYDYLEFGGFPSGFYDNNYERYKKLLTTVDKIVNLDMENFKDISNKTQNYTFQLLYFLALQQPGEISHGAMAAHLECNTSTVRNILDILEKTHLLYLVGPYSSSPKRLNKPYKYYFAMPCLKHALSLHLGIATVEQKTYRGFLFENLVASNFFNLKNRSMVHYNIYYDPRNEKNVDFIVQKGFNKPVPIEVSIGKKDKGQIKDAISKYKSDFGIIISNDKKKIVKEDNIIYLPPETFSLM